MCGEIKATAKPDGSTASSSDSSSGAKAESPCACETDDVTCLISNACDVCELWTATTSLAARAPSCITLCRHRPPPTPKTPEQATGPAYTADLASLNSRPVPQWFNDAKLGLFVHWGLYSVPAFAPDHGATFRELLTDKGQEFTVANNPYAEWYWNALHVPGSPAAEHHKAVFGDAPYTDFQAPFEKATADWTPEALVTLARALRVRYAVLTSKHHEGYPLWPSAASRPGGRLPRFHSPRDLVGDFVEAMRGAGVRAGLYYSGGYDWSYLPESQQKWATDTKSFFASSIESDEYIAYVNEHYSELLTRYAPDVLWNDFSIPVNFSKLELFARYYDRVPTGVVNDRWNALPEPFQLAKHPQGKHADFRALEMESLAEIHAPLAHKWEFCRGLDNSFGVNEQSKDSSFISADALVDTLVDVVSKNGNLLINVGPYANGSIPRRQLAPLAGLSDWLDINGEAIFDTEPWDIAEATPAEYPEVRVRFTQSSHALYIILLDEPACFEKTFNHDPKWGPTHKSNCAPGTPEWEESLKHKIQTYTPPEPGHPDVRPCQFTLPNIRFQAGLASEAKVKLLGHPGRLSFDADGPPRVADYTFTVALPVHFKRHPAAPLTDEDIAEAEELEARRATKGPGIQAMPNAPADPHPEEHHALHWHRYAQVFKVTPKPIYVQPRAQPTQQQPDRHSHDEL